MPLWIWAIVSLLTVPALIWLIKDECHARVIPRLAPSAAPASAGPLVSVIIPARDEAARIGDCLAGLVAQTYRQFEVIVLDDHSTDGTASIATQYHSRLPALSVIAGAALPRGWTGKCWACAQAADRARGTWLVFLDADVAPQPQLLAKLVERATERDLGLLTLAPLVQLRTPAERLVLPGFVHLLHSVYPFAQVNEPASPVAFAIGQCMCFRRRAYHAIGGHQSVAGRVLEDVELGDCVKRAGLRLEVAEAPELISVHMYTNMHTLTEGLQKHAIAGARHGGWRAARAAIRLVVIAAIPLWAAAAGYTLTLLGLSALLAAPIGLLPVIWSFILWGRLVRSRHGAHPLWGILAGPGVFVYFIIVGRAISAFTMGRGVRWKGRILADEPHDAR